MEFNSESESLFLLQYHTRYFIEIINFVLIARHSCASAVLGVVILSVRLSVSLPHAWFLTKPNNGVQILDSKRKGANSLTPTVAGGATPLLSEICAQNDPPPSKNADFDKIPLITSQPQEIAKKVQLWRIGSRPRVFQRAIDSVRTLPLSPPKGGSKSDFFRFFE